MVRINFGRYSEIAYWIMIIVVVSFCIFLFFYLTTSAKDCLANPLEYYMKYTNSECYCIGKMKIP